MKVYFSTNELPEFKKAVVTIGTFDGVHLGHQQIINQLREEAARIGGETVIVTFDPHPRKIVSENPLELINTLEEKTALLAKNGIDHLVVVPFTEAFSRQDASAYVEDFLIGRFHPHTVIIGYDHRFGKGRLGDFKLLEDYAAKGHFELIEIAAHLLHSITISSTIIRKALISANLEEANNYLGYSYFFEGVVIEGNKLGRTISYPTANLLVEDADKLIPGNGVYAVTATLAKGSELKGMMNIGVRPTVGGIARVIEVNLFDFDKDIYGEKLQVTLRKYLRAEQKFAGLDALKDQLAIDKTLSIKSLV
ncbi:MAG: riboflavin biosynthesis protein RibF [Gemmatimonadaceae bacterium]|nr:riboflavin biosynthesis protein RibF [Chitinophagaceae bacterium]